MAYVVAAKWRAHPGKAERLLGWKPRVTLREGLANSFRWAAERNAAGSVA